MPRSLALYFDDLLKASDSIFRFTAGMDREAYESNELIRAAVERWFSIIGEALAQMRHHYPEAMQRIEDSKKIIAFRNVLMHMYSTVDDDDVWSAIESKLPSFRAQGVGLLEEFTRTQDQ